MCTVGFSLPLEVNSPFNVAVVDVIVEAPVEFVIAGVVGAAPVPQPARK
jgi:hypothetical protein